jgi:hypothetical protein
MRAGRSPARGTTWPASPSTAASLAGLWPITSARPPSGSPCTTCRSAETSSQDSCSARSGWMARVTSSSAPLPAAVAACRQRSSTDDLNPVAAVIGMSSWPAACRKISSIWVARAAPVETNAAHGGCSRSRPIASASAAPCGSGDHRRCRCAGAALHTACAGLAVGAVMLTAAQSSMTPPSRRSSGARGDPPTVH